MAPSSWSLRRRVELLKVGGRHTCGSAYLCNNISLALLPPLLFVLAECRAARCRAAPRCGRAPCRAAPQEGRGKTKDLEDWSGEDEEEEG
eukprot:5137956-Pyramimonas_sp.AAC.1